MSEPEWQYAVEYVQVDGWVNRELHPSRESAFEDYRTCGMNCPVVRHRKAGQWERVTRD